MAAAAAPRFAPEGPRRGRPEQPPDVVAGIPDRAQGRLEFAAEDRAVRIEDGDGVAGPAGEPPAPAARSPQAGPGDPAVERPLEPRPPALPVEVRAEGEGLPERAREKLRSKNLDFIVANEVSADGKGIDSERNSVLILDREGGTVEVPESPKAEVAERILDRVFGPGARP